MASRMDRYNNDTSLFGKRSVKNENLYKDIYENTEYSNISGVATLEKTNEISIEQIKELLKERENIKKRSSTVKRQTPNIFSSPVEERNYDIRDVLSKAKDEHVEDNRNRSLRDTQYNILKSINIDNSEKSINHDIENTGVIKSYDDEELSLDMLGLKSTGDTIVEKTNVGDLLKEVKEAKDTYQPNDDDGLDKSFYTSSLNFKEDDFEQLKDIQDSIDSNNKLIKVLFALLFLVILAVIGFVVFKFIK